MPPSLANLAKRRLEALANAAALAPAEPVFRGAAADAQTTTAREWIISGPYETGKTWAALWRLDTEARRWPGSQWALVRKVRADMDGSVLVTWKRIIAVRGGAVAFGGERPQWYDYPNGARVWVGGLDRPEKTLSGERDGIYVNQAEELEEHDWETVGTRTTGRGAVTDTPMLFGDCNPGPADHWIVRRRDSGALRLLESRHEDNPSLFDAAGQRTVQGERTMAILDALTGVRYLRGRLGQWVGAEGMYFAQLSEERHLVNYPRVPTGWAVWGALDYGWAHPLAFGLFARDSTGRVCLMGAHHVSRWYIPQHVDAMDGLLAQLGVRKAGLKVVAGHDCWAGGHDDPETIADKFSARGYHLERAVVSRVIGARALGERLGNPECSPRVEPSLFFNRQARGVFDTLARMVHDPRNTEDVLKVNADAAGRGGDDDYDMCRYGVMEAGATGWDAQAFNALSSGRRL